MMGDRVMNRPNDDSLGYLNADWVLDYLVIQQKRSEADIAALPKDELYEIILDIGDFAEHKSIAAHTVKWVQILARQDTEIHA